MIDATFTRANPSSELGHGSGDIQWILNFVAVDLGIGFVLPGIKIPPTVQIRDLASDDLRRPLYLATTKNHRHRPTVKAFTTLLTGEISRP